MRFLEGKLGNRFDNVNRDDGMYWDVMGYIWSVLSCNGVY